MSGPVSRSPGARAAALATVVGCALLWACGTNDGKVKHKYALEGSLTDLMKFPYDEVRFESDPTQFALNFIAYRGESQDGGVPAGEDVTLKVTVRTAGLDAETLVTLDFDLAEALDDAGLVQRGVLNRNVLNDPRWQFTSTQKNCKDAGTSGECGFLALERGGLKLSTLPQEQGQKTNGSFHVTFAPGLEFYSGRTLFGDFTAVVP